MDPDVPKMTINTPQGPRTFVSYTPGPSSDTSEDVTDTEAMEDFLNPDVPKMTINTPQGPRILSLSGYVLRETHHEVRLRLMEQLPFVPSSCADPRGDSSPSWLGVFGYFKTPHTPMSPSTSAGTSTSRIRHALS